jgi:hypothetical protein
MDKYIPKTLQEAIDHIVSKIPAEEKEAVKDMTLRSFMGNTHHFLGRNLRNDWGLWFNENELTQYFSSLGINHGDDRSGIILESVYRHLHGDPIEMDTQVEKYKAFWKGQGFKDGVHPPAK